MHVYVIENLQNILLHIYFVQQFRFENKTSA